MYEAFDWQHGVFVGAAMRSEATAAAEHKGQHTIVSFSGMKDNQWMFKEFLR